MLLTIYFLLLRTLRLSRKTYFPYLIVYMRYKYYIFVSCCFLIGNYLTHRVVLKIEEIVNAAELGKAWSESQLFCQCCYEDLEHFLEVWKSRSLLQRLWFLVSKIRREKAFFVIGEPHVLQSMGSQRVRHNLATEQQQQKIINHFIKPSTSSGKTAP